MILKSIENIDKRGITIGRCNFIANLPIEEFNENCSKRYFYDRHSTELAYIEQDDGKNIVKIIPTFENGLLIKENYSDGNIVEYKYDHVGRLTEKTSTYEKSLLQNKYIDEQEYSICESREYIQGRQVKHYISKTVLTDGDRNKVNTEIVTEKEIIMFDPENNIYRIYENFIDDVRLLNHEERVICNDYLINTFMREVKKGMIISDYSMLYGKEHIIRYNYSKGILGALKEIWELIRNKRKFTVKRLPL